MAFVKIESSKRMIHGSAAIAAVLTIVLSSGGLAQSNPAPTTRPARPTSRPYRHPTTQPVRTNMSHQEELNALREKALLSIKSPEGGYPTSQPISPRPASPKPAAKPVTPTTNPPKHAAPVKPTTKTPGTPGSQFQPPSRPPQPPMHAPGKPGAPTPGGAKGPAIPVAPANLSATTAPAGIEGTQTTMTFTIAPVDPESRTYRFDYSDTPWNDVLADFSRMSGLSFLNQPDPPITETLTFRSPKDFTYKEALDQLNELLTSRQINKYVIQREERFLTIDRLPDAMKKIPPSRMFGSFEELEKAHLGQYDVALVNMTTPEGWTPYEIIEKFRIYFTDTYGMQVNGEKIELTGQVWEHFRCRELLNRLLKLTNPQKDDPRPMLTIPIKNVRVADLQTMLRQLFPPAAPAAPGRGPGVDPALENAKKTDILADIKNNTLIIKAPSRQLTEIAEMVAKFDVGDGPSLPEMKVIKLEYADAGQLSAMLKQMFMKEQQALMNPNGGYVSPEQKANLERDIFPDPASNSVILVGGKEGIAKAETLVKQWDTPAENQVTEVVELKNADANALAATLANTFPQTGKGGMPDRFTPRTNSSLLVACARQNFEKIKGLIEKLDVPADDEAKEHVVQPKGILPSVLAQILQQAVAGAPPHAPIPGQRPGQPQAPGGMGPRFIPDDATGFLFAYCSDKEWEKAEPLIKKIDEKAVVVEPKLRSFPLKHASATDVATMLRQMFVSSPSAAGKPQAGSQQIFFADTFNNAVQIYASDEFLEKITPFIAQLDIATVGDLTVIKLAHAKAEAIVPVLAQAFPGAVNAPMRAMTQSGGQAVPPPSPVSQSGGGVRIVPEPITNSLLVTAPAKELAQIKDLVAAMEAEAEKQTATRIILTPEHRPAAELAETLRSLAGVSGRPAGKAISGAGGAATPTGGEALNIVAAGNQIILDGPQDQVAKSVQLFQQLDVPYEQAIYRKYAVQDAAEDEKKLRAMLAMSAAAPKTDGGAGKPGAPVAPHLAAPEAIQIYADTNENTLLVAAKSEADFKILESVLTLMFEDPRKVKGAPETGNQDYFVLPLKHKEVYDIAFTVKDILNPDRKPGGVSLEEGPTRKTLLVTNCKPGQRAKLEELVKMFDVPDTTHRNGIRTIDSDKMPAELLVRLLQRNYEKPLNVLNMGDAGRVQVIDIHEGEPEEPANPEPKPGAKANPCVLPLSLLHSLAAVSLGQGGADKSDDKPLEPAVCPICHQSPCVLPAELLKSLDAVSMGAMDDELQPESTTRPTGGHNHPVTEKNVSGLPGVVKEVTDEGGPPTIYVDQDTGKIILKGTEEQLNDLEDIISEITSGDQPVVFRKFPLKYADVTTAGQLLETIFNQGQAVAGGKKGSKTLPMIPAPQPAPAAPQPGQPGKPGAAPGQPGAPQQPQQMVQPAAPARIKVIPDTRTSSLFVAAALSDIPLVIDVLKQIDSRTTTQTSNIRFFKLKNLDATQVVENLREVLNVQSGPRNRRPGQPNQPGQPPGQPDQGQQQQVIQLQGQPGQGATVSPSDNISLTADPQTNSIIAKAPLESLELIASLIKEMDESDNTMKSEMRRVQLAHARATEIATIVKDVTSKMAGAVAGGPGPRSGRTNPGVSVNADPRTNSVILFGQAKDLDQTDKIIKEMDIDAVGGTIRQFPVKGDATTIANAIKTIFVTGQQTDIVITADTSTSIVLVKAPAPQMMEIEAQIKAMEAKIAGSTGVRMIKLIVANAETVAEKMQSIFADARNRSGGKQSISIKGNKSNSTLYVSGADDDIFKTIETVAHDMDKAPLDFMVKAFKLKHASAVDVNQKLTEMMIKASQTDVLKGAKLDLVGVVPDARTNALIVTGGPITFGLIGSILDQVDLEAKDSLRFAKTYSLPPSVDANQVAANIQQLLTTPTAQSNGQEPPTVSANPGANVVIINANAKQHEEIKKTILDPVVASVGKGPQETRFVELKHGRADEIARAMMDSIRNTTVANARGQYPISVTAEPTSNKLIVTAPSDDFEKVEKMIAALDSAGEGVRKESTITVENTSPADVARSLQQVFNASVQGKPGRTPPTIQEVPGSTHIIVMANEEELAQIKNLVKRIDVEGSKGRMVHTITLPDLIPAKSVAENIKQLFGSNKEDSVKAEYHEPTNTLLVRATDAEFERINEQVIKNLKETPLTNTLKIFKIQLRHAVADEVAKTLQDFFDKKAGITKNANANLPPWMRGGEPPAKQLDNQVSIVAETSSNMLLVNCTDATKKLIDSIISDIDTDMPPGGKSVMEMVSLKYMGAEDMLGILTEYLKVSKRTPSDEGGKFVPWWMDGKEEKKEEKVVLAGDMRLKAVDSLNAIIVVGKPEGVADAVRKIKELDVENPDSPDVPQRIVLKRVSASEIADTLNKVFNDPNIAKTKGKSYIMPVIVPQDTTNSLIVRAKTNEFNLIKKMAENLDNEVSGDEAGGVRILQVATGQNVDDLAVLLEKSINEAEKSRQQVNKEYKPRLVSIGADPRANALLVSGTKAQYEQVQALVNRMVAMGPAGGIKRVPVILKSMTPQQAKQLIETIQKGPQGGKGPRSDADWKRDHREMEIQRERKGPVRKVAFAVSIPAFVMQATLCSAMGQTHPQPTTRPTAPMISTIRPRTPPAKAPPTKAPATRAPAKSPASRPTTTQPARPKALTPEEVIRAKAAESGGVDLSRMTDAARDAFRKKLSGAPVSVAEAGEDTIVIEGNEGDVDVLLSVLEMLDTVAPAKKIEYVTLKNASAKDLAKTLADVFQKIEQRTGRKARPEDKVDIIADQRTNGLYIAATDENMTKAMNLIQKNEESAPSLEKNVKTFVFKNRRVMEGGEVLRKMVASYLKQKGLDATQISIELDPQTNTALVTAGGSDMAFVEKVISGLDAELPATEEGKRQPIGESDVMVVPLRIAQADTLGTLLNELLKKAATGDTPMKDFIRRFRLLDEKGNPLATVNLDRPIYIVGDKDSNSLIIASTRDNCLIMKQVAAAFDKEPARAEVQYRVFTLKYADAADVAEAVDKLVKDAEGLTQRPGKGDKSGVPEGAAGSLVYKAIVSSDPRTNQVILVARPDALPILGDLITKMDIQGLDVMPFEIVKLEYASPTGMQDALTELVKQRAEALPKGKGPNADKAEKVVVIGDVRSRSLIIAAKQARREELRGLIKKLDVPATALIEDIRTITLKKGRADEMADKLKKLWEEKQKQQETGAKGGLKFETPAIVADERSNSLVIAASKGDFDAIKSVVEKIEALELNPMSNIYIVKLKYNSAKQLQTAMKALFDKRAEMRGLDSKSTRPEDKVELQVDEVSNSLLMVGSRENYDLLAQKVKELDIELGVPGQIEFFVCTNVGAHRVKDTIDGLFKEGVFKPGGGSGGDVGKAREKVNVSIDDRSNMLMVSASPENMELVREIYKRMNSVATPWDVAITKMIVIEHGDSVKIAAQIQDYFKKLDEVRDTGGDKKGKSGFGITIFADERSNRIVIGGTKDGIDSAVELVKQMDVPPGTPGQVVEVYKLTEAPASKIAEIIDKVFKERNKPRGGDSGPKVENVPVIVQSEASTNSLLINASREDHILLKELITRLDRPSTLLEMVKVIPLEKAPSARVKEILEELYKGGKTGDSKDGGGGVAVVEDSRTNSVVVTAPPGELENIATLVKRLDETEVKGQAEVGIYRCENEDAATMADLLNSIMTGQGVSGGGSKKSSSSSSTSSSSSSTRSSSGGAASQSEEKRDIASMLISLATKDERGREIFLKTIRENVQITSNERTNSVIVVAPPSSLKLIEQLIRELDQIQKRPVMVKVFVLRNADATKMIDLLDKMFAQEEGKEEEAAFQRGREITVEGGGTSTTGVPAPEAGAGTTAKGTFGRPKTTFVADERTNAIIVAGWPEDIDVVADVIDRLDSQPIQDRENVVYSLVNQQAKDVQGALDEYFQAETQRLDSLGDTVSPQRRMEQEVSIIAHEPSNQLILSVSPRYKQQVMSLIEQIDTAPPQVMIQVMIAEVTLDDRFEMGLEFALQQLRFSETAVPGGNGVLQSSHFDVVGGTDLGAAGSGLGGFSFTLTGEDFNFLVRALQSDSRLEVIQRPMIMCQDNQQATIQIGQSVPTPSGSQAFAGQTSTQVQYQDVGVILNVEPHINPDGFVYMLVEPEVSSVSDSTLQIAPGAFAPVINQRRATTYVSVKDGETVVIGGLITTSESEAEAKVPVLGDIPGLGILFRSTVRTKNKTELLIAMTPKVVRTIEDGRRISIEARDQSGIITDNMKQSPLFGELQVKPESEDEISTLEGTPESGEGGVVPANYEGPAMPVEKEPGPAPAGPLPAPREPQSPKPIYGPEVPKYGPMAPSSEDAVARR